MNMLAQAFSQTETSEYLVKNPPQIKSTANLLRRKTYDVTLKCHQEDFDPIKELIGIFKGGEASIDNKVDICKTLLSYMAPKLQSIRHTGAVQITHEQVVKQLMGITEPITIEAKNE